MAKTTPKARENDRLDIVHTAQGLQLQADGYDKVNPDHYKTSGGLQAIDVIEMFGLADDAHLATAVIYLLRAGKKPDSSYTEDVVKAIWWLKRSVNFHGGHPDIPRD